MHLLCIWRLRLTTWWTIGSCSRRPTSLECESPSNWHLSDKGEGEGNHVAWGGAGRIHRHRQRSTPAYACHPLPPNCCLSPLEFLIPAPQHHASFVVTKLHTTHSHSHCTIGCTIRMQYARCATGKYMPLRYKRGRGVHFCRGLHSTVAAQIGRPYFAACMMHAVGPVDEGAAVIVGVHQFVCKRKLCSVHI